MGFNESNRTQNCKEERFIIMNTKNIPIELQTLHQWVCSSSKNKLPMIATCPAPASSTDPNTWSTFEESVMSVECGNYDNIGFVFNDNGIVGIDIDTGYDDDGFLTDIASYIIGTCGSYTEKSRSGRGFHILIKGNLPFKGKNNLSGVEIYKQSRYFIMTGDVFMYDKIIENQEAIDLIINKYFSVIPKDNVSADKPFTDRIYHPVWEKPISDKIKLRPVYPDIPNGCRNICLTSLAGMLHSQGYSAQQIYNELEYCNKVACKPMVQDRELINIVKSVTKYKR